MEKTLDLEVLAGMSVEQLDAVSAGEAPVTKETDEGTASLAGEQVVEEGAATGATGVDELPPEVPSDGEAGDGKNVEMKGGKGTIPYGVLKETREELAETKRKLEELQARSYKADIPINHATQMEEVANEFKELAQKFEEGDLDWEDYQAQLDTLNQRKDELLTVKIKAEISHEMTEQATVSAWEGAVSKFLDSKPNGYDYQGDTALYGELDTMVKALGNDPANADKDYQWFLDTAHAVVMVKHGGASKVSDGEGLGGKQPSVDQRPFHTLSDIPGGLAPGKDGIDQVTSLSGPALTNRFINDPAEIDKVLSSLN